MLAALIGRIVACCSHRAYVTILAFVVLTAGAVFAATHWLDVTTDTGKMFSANLPWKKQADQMARLFPQNEDRLVAVVKADLPEEGIETARALTDALRKDSTNFRHVNFPEDNPFLLQHGLLYLDTKPLENVLDSTINAQPFLGTLAADPSARGLYQALSLIGEGVATGQAGDLSSFHAALDGFAKSLSSAANGHPELLSWQRLLASNLADMAGQYQFVVTQPLLDYGSLQPGGKASDAMRAAINKLEFVQSGHAKVYITGDVQINDEEFATVAQGMVAGLIVSLILVTLWLKLAVRSWRIIIPIVITLVVGLVLTTAFAALAVGTLNLISVAFAILFVGIAVDFAIQFCVRFRAQRNLDGSVQDVEEALLHTGTETGHQILVAAAATAVGFLGFTPTAFVGVAQLGLIAGFGMLIAFVCTVTLLPALLRMMRPSLSHPATGFAFAQPADKAVRRYRKPLLGAFATIAVLGAALIPKLSFDADPLHTKNPNSEGMRAIHLLAEDPVTSPYGAEMLVKDETVAADLAKRFSALPSVHDVLWLGSYVPQDQKTKLALINDAASILLPTLIVDHPAANPDANALRAAAAAASKALAPAMDKIGPQDPLRTINAALTKLSTAPDNVVLAANEALTRFLPGQLSQLRSVLTAGPVTIKDIPDSITRDYALPDGRQRLEIHPKSVKTADNALDAFVAQIRTVSPDVGGTAVTVVESARTMVHAFVFAALSALLMIAIILFAALRKLLDVVLVLTPLLLSALMTVILIIVVPEPLNFANIIALPLLLGVGVSFNVYFVMNWRSGIRLPLSSPTARAVLFSALTTGTAFGSLAMSHHPGTASMGRLLLLSLGCTLVATLVFVPALLPKRRIDEN